MPLFFFILSCYFDRLGEGHVGATCPRPRPHTGEHEPLVGRADVFFTDEAAATHFSHAKSDYGELLY